MDTNRIVRAFLVAPLVGPTLVWLAGELLPHSGSVQSVPAALWALGVMLVFGTPLAYGAALLVGLPTLWVLKMTHRRSVWPCCLAGAAAAVLVVIVAGPATVFFARRAPGDFLVAAVIGSVAGLAFWWIGLKPMPMKAV